MKNQIRAVMLIQRYHPYIGGAEKQLASLVPLLQQSGCEVHVLTRRYSGLAPFEEVNGVPVHRLPIPGPKPAASLSFTLTALPLIKKLAPDILHAHELLSPTTTAIAAKRLFGIPVVAKVLRGGILGDLAKLKGKPFGARRIGTYRNFVDAFITISSEIDAELREIGVPEEKRPFIPNGVDTIRFCPADLRSREEIRVRLKLPSGPITLFAGRLAPEKRLDQLLTIWPHLRRIHPDANLLILGTGEHQEELKRMTSPGVLFAGNVEDVVPYLQCADLFVLPSATEGLSNALLEAMSTGIAVLATAVGGAPDLIESRRNGWLIPPDRPELLRGALVQLLRDSSMREAFGRNARHSVIENYSLSAVAQKLCDLYARIAAKKPAENFNIPLAIP